MARLIRLTDGAAREPRELVAELGMRDDRGPGERPRVVAVMIASADGRATVQGRSVGLGHPADRALLRELRAGADAILVGTATIAAEHYANLLDPDQRAWRAEQGLPEHPLIATVSRRLELPAQAPVFSEPGLRIVVATESDADMPAGEFAAQVELVPFGPGTLDLPGVLAALGARGVRGVVCEGGPLLLRELVAADCVDDLLLTVAPLLVAGAATEILAGDALPDPARLALLDVHRADDHLFLHYGARR